MVTIYLSLVPLMMNMASGRLLIPKYMINLYAG